MTNLTNCTKGHIIGCGSTATVSLATTVTGDRFAVKSTELSKSLFLQKEQQFLSKLRSRYIIEYIGFDVDYANDIPMYDLFMEYATGGTITDVIKRQGGSLDECLIRSYTHQILQGLDYLHSNNLVHCDIKCSNILVCEDGVKIGDLGCAKLVEKCGDTSSGFSGTPVFMAPEVARGEKQGFAADVWAAGCAVIEMATGCNPWPEMKNPVSALYRIGCSGDVPLFPIWLSDEGKDFLRKCLQLKDEERWTVKELLQHPFVNINSSSKKIESFDSPSSILDHGFWDSFEVTETPSSTKFMTFSGESPVDRIKKLVETTPCVNYCMTNWIAEEDWITVRSNNVDENSNITHEDSQTDAEKEDDDSESDSESLSELYVEAEFSDWVRIIVESNVLETSGANVVNSKFLDFKNINNDSCLLVDSNLNVALLIIAILAFAYILIFK
ncbi:putative mitogen-activated protein kinase kinase kinase STE-STE11 family [Helianthus annuus]|nr:putative mitogen-activated protein kinase kinase kinase STE-STE11 family [Helianthus annuus]